ncbi:MAG: site-specific DNA-methyltransferase [Pedobacter sp.]|nr:site-specific DNA-methyltransferase [Pedobacter sp.]MDQ8052752.1 site-specific DNA-methyltransferase [Pedobacter sp.]
MPTLHWIGKDKVINHHLDVPFKVLDFKYGFSGEKNEGEPVNSGNLIINGDNLEALKSLLPKYEGKVKCIYIDPPYNTGNEGWIYNDNSNSPQLLKWFNKVVGREGEDLTRHDKWLCMMYPRIKLLHRLLAKDGAIFISIEDNEQANLKLLLDEIFGISNYLGNLIWRKKEGGGQTDKYFVTEHEYICVYQKSNHFQWIDNIRSKGDKEFNKSDSKGLFKLTKLEKWGSGARKEDRETMHFPIISPNNEEYYPVAPDGNPGRWRVGREKMNKLIEDGLVHWEIRKDKYIPYEKTYKIDSQNSIIKERSILYDVANTAEASKTLTQIFNQKDVFDTPKPVQLIEFILRHTTQDDSIVLDSFAGSGTTAQAVLNLNKQNGNRKFILIEMEEYAESITAERVKRVIRGNSNIPGLGGSFDYYGLGEPLFSEDEILNSAISEDSIREYIWYSETRSRYFTNSPFSTFLGTCNGTDYYFMYEKDNTATLDYQTLAENIKHKAERYIIYADNCLLSESFMLEKNIEFKKSPRDISRF